MHVTVRRKVFETASSSVHSLSVEPGELSAEMFIDADGILRIFPGEFGWGIDKFTDAATKASYCYTYLQYTGSYKEGLQDRLKRVIQEQTKAKDVVFENSSDEYYPEGYIDHKSTDVCGDVFESDENIRNFIFNPSNVLVIDNDNH